MTTPHDPAPHVWRKSSHSNGEGGACLEVGDGPRSVVPVRDSKAPQGPVLLLTRPGWAAFVAAVRAGTLA
ncbi:DUF397 domain-containing protein [Streptomyces genisteinicus]|uniref:DUF397 domain-containing protein n=1 Tax=Streptomyces genisteinicus TaxID=2768068 RepID=A0A7H0HT45_9ACTN|nr:DUF397 domain-containing protein [Streptomyces genisteinicus]QNP63711.1 DUF397 domain-containing protein [Streptomyces genisteinicus]